MKISTHTIKVVSIIFLAVFMVACAVTAKPETTPLGASPIPTSTGAAPLSTEQQTNQAAIQKTPLGAFTTNDTKGNEVTNEVFSNAKLTMLNVWATFCGYCIQEMPELNELSKEYADKGVQIIGLVGDVGDDSGNVSNDEVQQVVNIYEKAGAEYLQLLPSSDLQSLILNYVSAFPTTIFIDSNGNILDYAIAGSRGNDYWKSVIDGYLNNEELAQ